MGKLGYGMCKVEEGGVMWREEKEGGHRAKVGLKGEEHEAWTAERRVKKRWMWWW